VTPWLFCRLSWHLKSVASSVEDEARIIIKECEGSSTIGSMVGTSLFHGSEPRIMGRLVANLNSDLNLLEGSGNKNNNVLHKHCNTLAFASAINAADLSILSACVKSSLPPLQPGKALFEILPSALKIERERSQITEDRQLPARLGSTFISSVVKLNTRSPMQQAWIEGSVLQESLDGPDVTSMFSRKNLGETDETTKQLSQLNSLASQNRLPLLFLSLRSWVGGACVCETVDKGRLYIVQDRPASYRVIGLHGNPLYRTNTSDFPNLVSLLSHYSPKFRLHYQASCAGVEEDQIWANRDDLEQLQETAIQLSTITKVVHATGSPIGNSRGSRLQSLN
jgi:hypothetical protein